MKEDPTIREARRLENRRAWAERKVATMNATVVEALARHLFAASAMVLLDEHCEALHVAKQCYAAAEAFVEYTNARRKEAAMPGEQGS